MMFDPLRKAMLAGFGAQEKIKELVDELVKRGELSNSEGARIVRDWSEQAEKSTNELNKTLTDIVTQVVERLNPASKEDIKALQNDIEELNRRLRSMESSSSASTGGGQHSGGGGGTSGPEGV